MEYKETLNLPRTDFPMKANLLNIEPEIQKLWQEKDIYSLLRNRYIDSPKYILHDGPPYANGDIHIGHALNKILKDIIIKYKSMQGFDAPYIPGWDCHGLPIEHKVSEQKGNKDLTQSEIRQKCRQYALNFVQLQKEQFKRLGIFGDWENPYLTLLPEYCAKIIETFGKMVEKGYIYKSLKPVYWCSTCCTALAEAEVEYSDKKTPSICVKFKILSSNLDISYTSAVLIWTTTPWTLPGNVAIAFHPSLEYAAVKVDNEVLILASDLVEQAMDKGNIKSYEIISRFAGKELEGIICQHPFIQRQSVGVLAEYVTKDQGTGCVHIAPGHGLEDYDVGLKYNLPILAPVDGKGRFTQDVPEFEGLNVFDANKGIIERIEDLGKLFYKEDISHSYPHCWRCKRSVIFRATDQWFVNLQANDLQKKGLEAVKKVNWIPKWGEDRFYNTLESRGDWCISRQRAWGVPIIAFTCLDCKQYILDAEIIKKIAQLVAKQGMDIWFERSIVDLFSEGIVCPHCNSKNINKEKDILDVWFDSGVSHQAILRQRQYLAFPADMYLEGSDQHRGWFQSALITSMAIEGVPPYKSVLTHGFMLDDKGKAMSKSAGNVISPFEIIQKYGADILRLWVISEDYRYDVKLSKEILQQISDSYRKIRNTWRFMLSNLYDFNPNADKIDYEDLLDVDKWILYRLNRLIENVTQAYETFEFHLIYHFVVNFCTVDLSAVYLDITKDRLYTFAANDKQRKACQTAIYRVLTNLISLMAPILSFTCEEIWRYLPVEKAESVHLSKFPLPNPIYKNEALSEKWENLLRIRSYVSTALEQERKNGVIGSSLEAKVIITIGNKGSTDIPVCVVEAGLAPARNPVCEEEITISSVLSEKYKQLLVSYHQHLPALFIVSQVELKISSEDSIGILTVNQKEAKPDSRPSALVNDNIWIEVKKADGNKCLRCWNYNTSVGDNKEYPDICERCVKAINYAKS